jgi:hypothetical protein
VAGNEEVPFLPPGPRTDCYLTACPVGVPDPLVPEEYLPLLLNFLLRALRGEPRQPTLSLSSPPSLPT